MAEAALKARRSHLHGRRLGAHAARDTPEAGVRTSSTEAETKWSRLARFFGERAPQVPLDDHRGRTTSTASESISTTCRSNAGTVHHSHDATVRGPYRALSGRRAALRHSDDPPGWGTTGNPTRCSPVGLAAMLVVLTSAGIVRRVGREVLCSAMTRKMAGRRARARRTCSWRRRGKADAIRRQSTVVRLPAREWCRATE